MKRRARPVVSAQGEQFLCVYEQRLRTHQDLTAMSIRTSLSDLRHVVAWYEQKSAGVQEEERTFTPEGVATSTITRYRVYLQRECHLKPVSINRTLISLKCSFAWLVGEKSLSQRPAKVVKRQEQESSRHLSDQEEQGLVAAATTAGCVRDRTLMLLLLHTGLRAKEACTLRRDQVQLSKRSGPLRVTGKRNTYRAVPLGSMVRAELLEYLAQLRGERPSKTNTALSERALASLVAKYAHLARLTDISSHDLRHHFGYRMAETVPLHRLAHMMGYDSLDATDTTRISVQGTQQDVQHAVETIAWA